MATTYATVTSPQLAYFRAGRVVGGKVPSGATGEAASGYQWVRIEYTVALYRIGQGMTSFSPVANAVFSGDTITWTGGSLTMVGSGSMSFKCLNHILTPEYQGTDIWRETAIYRWEGKWEQEEASLDANDNADFG